MKYAVSNLCKNYSNLKVLDNLSIEFKEGEVTCILGPSGCGKTTLLNILSGGLNFDSGKIIGFKDESISYVFQEDRLIEWKTVKQNLEFVLKDIMNKEDRNKIIDKYLKAVNMEEYKNYYPNKLSGGMRQRIAIIRAFIYKSNLLIMDEPFKSLDIKTKNTVMDCFSNLLKTERRTCILVTHDIDEAYYIADNIVTLSYKPTKCESYIKNHNKTNGL